MFDFVQVARNRILLAAMKEAIKKYNVGIFKPPFTSNLWIAYLTTTLALLLTLKFLSHQHHRSGKNSNILKKCYRFILFLAWSFFLIIEIYYEGALTMFFTTQSYIPFKSMREVIRAYPDWKLMMRAGWENDFLGYIESNDLDYIKFWNRVQEKPQESVYNRIEDVIEKHGRDSVVIYDTQSAVDSYNEYGRYDVADKLEVFYKMPYE